MSRFPEMSPAVSGCITTDASLSYNHNSFIKKTLKDATDANIIPSSFYLRNERYSLAQKDPSYFSKGICIVFLKISGQIRSDI